MNNHLLRGCGIFSDISTFFAVSIQYYYSLLLLAMSSLKRLVIFESSSGICLFSHNWSEWKGDQSRGRVCALVQFFFQLSREFDDGGRCHHTASSNHFYKNCYLVMTIPEDFSHVIENILNFIGRWEFS